MTAPGIGPTIVRRLGTGGTADVYLAELATGHRVALKRMRVLGPDALLRLKGEFRAVEHLAHPNLVRLLELGEDGEGLFFTMELVEGVDLGSYCGRGPRLQRLANVLPQLLDALGYLHANGVVHGDLSPRNVLVRDDGVVKLLDFGLHALVRAGEDGPTRAAGTPAYVAPERIGHQAPNAASDLYSLACMLFEIVAGRPPFQGTLPQVLDAHLHATPPDLTALVPELPPRLARACRALLAKRASERPSLTAVKADLLAPLGAHDAAVGDAGISAALVGRGELQDTLQSFLTPLARGDGVTVALHGPSGIGKSALAAWLAETAAQRGVVALCGRARPSERIAFNAMDGIVDGLARRLDVAVLDGATSHAAATAASTFPVLAAAGQRDLARDRTHASVRARLFGAAGHIERPPERRVVFDAVAELLRGEAGERGALIVIDDAQWADSDAVALLRHVIAAGKGRVGALLVLRSDLDPGPAGRWLAHDRACTHVDVPPLTDDAIAAILRAHAHTATADGIAHTAAACGGLPVLAIVAGRYFDAPDPLGAAVRDLVSHADAAAREVLALLAIADRPLAITELAELAAVSEASAGAAVNELVRRSLARWLPTRRAELFHDAIRMRAEQAMHADWLALARDRLAQYLADRATGDAERVWHLIDAGRLDDAARLARTAAVAATARHAYGQAAELYALALERPGADKAALLRGRAETLEGAARFAEAAECWRQLSQLDGRSRDADVTLREAAARLGARQIATGIDQLDIALDQLGVKGFRNSRLATLRTGARFLLGPTARPARGRTVGHDARHGEQLVRVGELLGYFDTLAGIGVLQRARDEFERAGAHEGAAWCDYLFALFALFGNARRWAGLAERYRTAADLRVRGRRPSSPIVQAFPPFLDGYAHLRAGRWHAAIEMLDDALAITTNAGRTATFEHRLTLSLRTSAVLMTQDSRAAEAAVTRFAATADDSSDSVMQCHVANARTVQLVLQGRLETAVDVAQALVAEWPEQPATVQTVLARAYAAFPDLFRQRGHRARRELTSVLALARQARLFPTAYGPILATWAALAEALALREGDRGASHRRVDSWAKLAAGRPSLQSTGALRARAYAADARGDSERAVELLAAAEREALHWRQPVDAAIAAYQRARRIGGSEGAELMSGARAHLAECGASPRLLDEDAAPPGRLR